MTGVGELIFRPVAETIFEVDPIGNVVLLFQMSTILFFG
jgi:hypothetical protein